MAVPPVEGCAMSFLRPWQCSLLALKLPHFIHDAAEWTSAHLRATFNPRPVRDVHVHFFKIDLPHREST